MRDSGCPTIALVICTLNRPKELRRLLTSVQSQIYPPSQVIIVDASDPSLNLSDDYPQALIINMPRGLTRQRNSGAQAATMDIVAFVDDDAVLENGCLQAIVESFKHDSSVNLGAVTGRLLADNHRQPRNWIATLFGLGQSNGKGRFKLSGFPSMPSGDAKMETEPIWGG